MVHIDNHTVRDLDDHGKPTGRWLIDPTYKDLSAALTTLDRHGKTLDLTAIRYAFRSWAGRVLAGLQLQKAGEDRVGVVKWRVKKID